MALYDYIAKTHEGREVRSKLEAGSRLKALEELRKRGLIVVELSSPEEAKAVVPKIVARNEAKAAPEKKAKKRREPLVLSEKKVKMTDLSVFCRQLAISVTAGVPLRDAIEGIGTELEHPALRRISAEMVESLHDGESFSDVVARHHKVFGSMFHGLIQVAEESGKLPETLKQLADYLEKADKLRRRIKAMAAYPIFIGVFFLIICLVMTLFILPQFSDIFRDLGSSLPTLTKVVFDVNTFVFHNFPLLTVGAAALIAVVVVYTRTPVGRYKSDKAKLSAPVVGMCVRKYLLARFCRSLAIMVRSGVPIASALEICANAAGNQLMKRKVLAAREMIMTGHRIAASLDKSGVFPGLVIRMVGVGEDSGQLPEVLDNVSDLYEDQVEVSTMSFMALLEPAIICVFGALILLLVLAIYLPIFSVSGGH